MHMNFITGFFALIREILRHPSIAKHNTKRNRFKNTLMVCFLLMFFGFMVMTEQAILQSQQKHELGVKMQALEVKIQQLENDLYIKKYTYGDKFTASSTQP